jgi:hypothetical protein
MGEVWGMIGLSFRIEEAQREGFSVHLTVHLGSCASSSSREKREGGFTSYGVKVLPRVDAFGPERLGDAAKRVRHLRVVASPLLGLSEEGRLGDKKRGRGIDRAWRKGGRSAGKRRKWSGGG